MPHAQTPSSFSELHYASVAFPFPQLGQFLCMKLATINLQLDYNMEGGYLTRDVIFLIY